MAKNELVHLRWNTDGRSYYNPSDLLDRKNASLRDLKQEYTRQRDIARKRVNRLEEKGLITKRMARKYRDMFPTIAELTGNIKIKDIPEEFRPFAELSIEQEKRNKIVGALSDVSKLLNLYPSTIPKARERKKEYLASLKQQLKVWGLDPDLVNDEDTAMKLWDLFDDSKEVTGKNIFYATKTQRKFLFSTEYLIDMVNQGEYRKVLDVVFTEAKTDSKTPSEQISDKITKGIKQLDKPTKLESKAKQGVRQAKRTIKKVKRAVKKSKKGRKKK